VENAYIYPQKRGRSLMIKRMFKAVGLVLVLTACFAQTMSFAYSGNNAIKYADKYADSPNSEYNHYGADCTNFVSQILYAGGLSQDSTWYSTVTEYGDKSLRTDSAAWTNADTFKNYIKTKSEKIGQWSKNAMTTPFKTYAYVNNSANLSSENVGKVVIFYDWNADNEMDHAAFYVANERESQYKNYDGGFYEGVGDLIDQHSNNRKRVMWRPDYRQESDPNQVDEVMTTRVHAFELTS
jgi:hypothetical protein